MTIIGSNNPKFDTIFNFQSPYRLADDNNNFDDDDTKPRIIYKSSSSKYISTAPPMHV